MSRLEHIAHFHQEFELPAEKSFSEEIIDVQPAKSFGFQQK